LKAPLFLKKGNEFTPNHILLLNLQIVWSKERGDKLTLLIQSLRLKQKGLSHLPLSKGRSFYQINDAAIRFQYFEAPLFFKEGNEFTPNYILLLNLQI